MPSAYSRTTKGMVTSLALLAGALMTSTCSSAGTPSSGGNPDVITREQILENPNYANVWEIVAALRPRWLQPGQNSFRGPVEPVVYVDNLRHGDIRSLRNIGLVGVMRITYINARDATTMYGTGHLGGIIRVSTRE